MNWLTEHYPHIAAALAAGAATGALDHLIAKAEKIIPNSAWQLAKSLIMRTPIKASQTDAGDMPNFAFLSGLESGIRRMKTLIAEAEEVIEAFKTVSAKVSALGVPAMPAVGTKPVSANELNNPSPAFDPSLTP